MRWTTEEENLLARIYPTASPADLERIFKRSFVRICQRAHALKIRRDGFMLKALQKERARERWKKLGTMRKVMN